MGGDPSAIGGAVDLGKGLFGYRKAEVHQMMADRDGMLAEAERRMRTSTARIAELEGALAETNGRNGRLQGQVEAFQAKVTALEGQLKALSARNAEVEKAAVRIKAEGERLAAWRKRMQAVAVTVPPALERFRLLIEEIPDRVQEALTPVALSGPALLARMDATARNLGEPTARRGLEQSDRSR
jgi:septal ring factor EnvC (AmiA/AmiB activator)